MARRAGQVGQDRLQTRGQTWRAMGLGHAAYVAAHRGNVADAAGRADLAGGRVFGHVGCDDRADLRSPPPRLHARRRPGDHFETITERFFGRTIGPVGNRKGEAAKISIIWWWGWEDSNFQPNDYQL